MNLQELSRYIKSDARASFCMSLRGGVVTHHQDKTEPFIIVFSAGAVIHKAAAVDQLCVETPTWLPRQFRDKGKLYKLPVYLQEGSGIDRTYRKIYSGA